MKQVKILNIKAFTFEEPPILDGQTYRRETPVFYRHFLSCGHVSVELKPFNLSKPYDCLECHTK